MATVQTVLGPVESERLGTVLSHEHVLIGLERFHYPWRFDMAATRARVIEELTEAKAGGIDTVIDLSTPDLARDVAFMADVSQASGMQIVAATGIWRDVPRYFWERDPDAIAEIFVREIEVGIDKTSIRAGAIKVASDAEGVTPEAERVLRGAARASVRTGCPISTHHAAPEQVGRRQLEVIQEEGVPLHQVCIGHSADTTDVGYLEDLLNAGVYLSMDRYPGRPPRPGWEQRNDTVRTLVERGWAHRLMLGHDYAPAPVLVGGSADRERPTRYLFVSTTALPALRTAGVSDAAIEMMMREVPRRFLAGEVSAPLA
ncbi:MAG: phosphotriesterase-related protein [Chloroflexi bacterium]|nr:phosphotriesterase-related protein [Chloroflexota bacterium]MDA1240778.1 phosphotriesterase-related protein [Chloroflexota bacterium]